ncbi:cache domain-containing protein [Leifsonia poae]|uniref:cache domain-containing protein n=1 Tax=Leifsonia poae TaxID=110933 RepID=UPI003D69D101
MAELAPVRPPVDAEAVAERVAELFDGIHSLLASWRTSILEVVAGEGATDPAALDERVGGLVLPELASADPLLIGAGFIAAPETTRTGDLHFAWWLGALDDNPVFGATSGPSRLDLASRAYAEYLRDFPSLEWYRVPSSTHRTHITGPYVDHLCACDYIVTMTSPVERDGAVLGVVGVDVYVKRLERELLPVLLATGEPIALVNASGRVLLSGDPAVVVGSVVPVPDDALSCAGTPFRVVRTARPRP